MSEWLKADKRVAVQTAAQAQEEQQAKDRATCAAAARKRKEYRSPMSTIMSTIRAHVYDQIAIERNIAAGYEKHSLNFSNSRAKKPMAQGNHDDILGT